MDTKGLRNRNQNGQAVVEFAAIFPIFLLTAFALIFCMLSILVYSTYDRVLFAAARDGAEVVYKNKVYVGYERPDFKMEKAAQEARELVAKELQIYHLPPATNIDVTEEERDGTKFAVVTITENNLPLPGGFALPNVVNITRAAAVPLNSEYPYGQALIEVLDDTDQTKTYGIGLPCIGFFRAPAQAGDFDINFRSGMVGACSKVTNETPDKVTAGARIVVKGTVPTKTVTNFYHAPGSGFAPTNSSPW